MPEVYGECIECGYKADSWEAARVHARDKHGGIKSGMLDIFDTSGNDD